jgi:hypothetical protein
MMSHVPTSNATIVKPMMSGDFERPGAAFGAAAFGGATLIPDKRLSCC